LGVGFFLAALAGLPVLEGARLFLAGSFFRGLTVFDVVFVLAVDLVARDGFLFFAVVLAVVFFVVTLFFWRRVLSFFLWLVQPECLYP
jgi:hypothetical protein